MIGEDKRGHDVEESSWDLTEGFRLDIPRFARLLVYASL